MQVIERYAMACIYACPIRYIMLSRCIIVTGYASSPRVGQWWTWPPSSGGALGPDATASALPGPQIRVVATCADDYPHHSRTARRAPPRRPRYGHPWGSAPPHPGGKRPDGIGARAVYGLQVFAAPPIILWRFPPDPAPSACSQEFLQGAEKLRVRAAREE